MTSVYYCFINDRYTNAIFLCLTRYVLLCDSFLRGLVFVFADRNVRSGNSANTCVCSKGKLVAGDRGVNCTIWPWIYCLHCLAMRKAHSRAFCNTWNTAPSLEGGRIKDVSSVYGERDGSQKNDRESNSSPLRPRHLRWWRSLEVFHLPSGINPQSMIPFILQP